jgi:hypothetical protein
MSRISALFAAACLCALCTVGATQAAVHHHAPFKHARSVKHPKIHGLGAPGLLTPANGARVEQVPTLTWSAVGGASEYEYQLAADPQFHSIVLGSGTGLGTAATYNRAAALSKPITDGAYYWRVRGLTMSKEPGAWSATRNLVRPGRKRRSCWDQPKARQSPGPRSR